MSTRPAQPVGLTLTALMRWMSQQQLDSGANVSPRHGQTPGLRLVGCQAGSGTALRAEPDRHEETGR